MKKRHRRQLCLALRHQAELEEQISFNLSGKDRKMEWIAARGAARALREFAGKIESEGRYFLDPFGIRRDQEKAHACRNPR